MRIVEPELPQSSGPSAGVDASRHACDLYGVRAGPIYLCAQRLHAGQCRCAIGPGRKIRKARHAFRECAQHGVAMADGLVAGQAQAAQNVAGGADQSFLNGSVHNFSGEMLRYFECIEPGES